MPRLVRAEKEYGPRGVIFVGASLDDDKTKGQIAGFVGHNLLTGSIGRAIWRARVKSVPDMMSGRHGDAAFADWVWSASLSRRF
jgi:hypothetical protein